MLIPKWYTDRTTLTYQVTTVCHISNGFTSNLLAVGGNDSEIIGLHPLATAHARLRQQPLHKAHQRRCLLCIEVAWRLALTHLHMTQETSNSKYKFSSSAVK